MAKGWLDNYNDYNVSAPEGMEGDGFSNVGRNSSPAWGGQFQNGGTKKPITTREDFDPSVLSNIPGLTSLASGNQPGYNRQEQYGPLGDLYRYYGGQPLEHDTLVESQNKPSTSKDKNAKYISLNHDREFVNEVLDNYERVSSGKLDKGIESKLNDNSWSVSGYSSAGKDAHKTKKQGSEHHSNAIGRYTLGKGKDKKGEYISYYDKFDQGTGDSLNPGEALGLTKPFEIYDRIYLKDVNRKYQMGGVMPGAVGHMYARTGSPSKGPRRNQTDVTDASAQNGKEMQYYQNGLDWKPKTISQDGSKLDYHTGDKVTYGTPEYREAYNRGEVITDEGVRSPIQLDEVVIKGKKKDKNWLEQYASKIVEENRDAGLLGAIIGTPISAITSLPQLMGMKALTGEMQRPSEGLDIKNPYGAMAVDAVADPSNWIGAGELTALGRLTKEEALAKLGNIKTSIAPELRQGLRTAGPSFGSSVDNVGSSYPSFKQITNAPENIDAEHLSGLIKKEADWLRSPEYLKRKMSATGRSEASIKKESENIINNINNTSINYTGTAEDDVSGLYSSGRNPKIQIFDGSPDYYGAEHPFYTGVLDHEVKHAFSETGVGGDPLLELITGKGYKNYPKANLNKNLSDKISSAFGMNWANLAPEQQVTGRRMMDVIENTQGIKRGTQLTDSNIESLIQNLKDNRFNNADMYHVALEFKKKFGDNYQTHLKDFLNKAWVGVPAAVGLGAASQIEQKREGGIIKDDRGQWDHPGEITEINSNDITMEGVPYDVLGVSDTGDTKLMKPGKNYKFKGKKVTEYPMAKNGVNQQDQKTFEQLDQLTNFTNYNTKQPGGWLDTL